MRLHKTGHAISDTVSDLIGEVPDGDYDIVYGILRHNLAESGRQTIFLDRGFWGADHYSGWYRLASGGTQPLYHDNGPSEPHGLELEPWIDRDGYILLCPPSEHVCKFFGINVFDWCYEANKMAKGSTYLRSKNTESPIDWHNIKQVITFNSTVGVEALRRGIPVISDPNHSTIGSYVKQKGLDIDRDELLGFMQAHQFKLSDREKIHCLINHYLSG